MNIVHYVKLRVSKLINFVDKLQYAHFPSEQFPGKYWLWYYIVLLCKFNIIVFILTVCSMILEYLYCAAVPTKIKTYFLFTAFSLYKEEIWNLIFSAFIL